MSGGLRSLRRSIERFSKGYNLRRGRRYQKRRFGTRGESAKRKRMTVNGWSPWSEVVKRRKEQAK